jgi:hypothetical protein
LQPNDIPVRFPRDICVIFVFLRTVFVFVVFFDKVFELVLETTRPGGRSILVFFIVEDIIYAFWSRVLVFFVSPL